MILRCIISYFDHYINFARIIVIIVIIIVMPARGGGRVRGVFHSHIFVLVYKTQIHLST